jgi:hypothetical protein
MELLKDHGRRYDHKSEAEYGFRYLIASKEIKETAA